MKDLFLFRATTIMAKWNFTFTILDCKMSFKKRLSQRKRLDNLWNLLRVKKPMPEEPNHTENDFPKLSSDKKVIATTKNTHVVKY